MLKSIIRTLLQKFIDDIDSDNCNITMEQQSKIISVLSNIANPDQRMSKIQACDYLGVSRATFDNYVRDGFIPKGIKQEGGYTSLTKESLDKMSKSLKQGYIDHPERKKRISEKLTGRKNSEETKRKKSLNNVRTKLISIDGELGSIRFWAIRIGMSHTALNYRLKTYGEDNLISFIKQKLN